MKVKTFIVGSVSTNCYVAYDLDSQTCVIIDPGAPAPAVLDFIKDHQLVPQAILLTHGHFDHIMGIESILEQYQLPVYAYEAELPLIENADLNVSAYFGAPYTYVGAQGVADRQMLLSPPLDFQVIHTPGHTKGSCCFYHEEDALLFTGDTLFKESVGRTDVPTGDGEEIIQSIKEQLLSLPENVIVYPGHGGPTSILHEKGFNPYL